jgi:chromosome segregation protein
VKILIPVDDETKGDPLSGRKKTALATLIGLAGFSSVAVFLLFGRLLQGYMTFDAGREVTERAHERLSADIKVQEASLSSLISRIAEAEERKASFAETEARFVVLTNQTSLAETERNRLLEALTTANKELASVTGTVAGLRVEIDARKREKSRLMEDADLKQEELEKRDAEVKKASEMMRQIGAEATSAKAALAETQKALQQEQLVLSNETTKVAGVRTEVAGLEVDLNRLRAKVDALAAEDARLAAAIDSAVSRTNRLAFGEAEAEKAYTSAVAELVKTQAALDAANAARDRSREVADSQSARVAALEARKEVLGSNIQDMEKNEARLIAALAELKKQQTAAIAEAAKAQAALDTLSALRDKAREEADAQSARAAALKAEAIALEKAKADVEKARGVPEK